MDKLSRHDMILATVSDLVADFLYYDRKEDECLQVGQIEEAIENEEVTIDEIVEHFTTMLAKGLEKNG